MHEFSVVQSLLELVEKNVEANDATKATRVEVKIGVLSGIEPHLLETAFNTFKEKTICEGAEFIMNIQPIVLLCKTCHEQSTLDEHRFKCPKCDSIEVEILDGEEMFLMRLELE